MPRIYQVITAGTSASSGGPTGTGSDITDGTVHWKYLRDAQYIYDLNPRRERHDLTFNGSVSTGTTRTNFDGKWGTLTEAADDQFTLDDPTPGTGEWPNGEFNPTYFSVAALGVIELASSVGAAARRICVLGNGSIIAGGGPVLVVGTTGLISL